MKIQLYVYNLAGGLRPMAHFFLKSKELNFFGIIHAIVDSGSPTTILGYDDITTKRISRLKLGRLRKRKEPLYMGGGQIDAKILEDAEFSFPGFKQEMQIVISSGVSSKSNISSQPSILGVDFLEKIKATFHFNPNKKEAYLEIED